MTKSANRSNASNSDKSQYFLAVATDGDGTLVRGGRMAQPTVRAVHELRRSGRKFLLITGETISQLEKFPHLRLFDCVVAENGAVLYWPRSRRRRNLARTPPKRLLQGLRAARYRAFRRGHSVISIKRGDARRLDRLLQELNLDWHVVTNRRAVMLLPAGVDKSSGLNCACGRCTCRHRELSPSAMRRTTARFWVAAVSASRWLMQIAT